MKIRADIAELLRAGVPQVQIARRLHCAQITVQRTREALNLPAHKMCRDLPATLEEAFQQYTRPAADGHIEWTGRRNNGTPAVTFHGTVHSGYRLAFRFHYGREPVGKVTSCETGCVAGRCVKDQPMREANRRADKAFSAIFGGALGKEAV